MTTGRPTRTPTTPGGTPRRAGFGHALPATYRLLLRAPGAAAFYVTAAIGRVGIAMTSLGVVWLVHHHTGSYATAGLVTGAFAVAEGVVGPQVARRIDRIGQTRVLPPLLVLHAVAVAALVACVRDDAPVVMLMGSAVGMGATIPQLGALSAARWAVLVRHMSQPELLPAAFSLESLSNAAAYLVGPVLVSAIGASGQTMAGTATAAALVVAGGGALAAQHATAPPTGSDAGHRRNQGKSLLGRTFLLLVAINTAIGIYCGAVQVSVTAAALEHHSAGAAATLYAISSITGLLGGWLFGRRYWRAAPPIQLVTAAAGLALASFVVVAAGSLPKVGVALGLAGFAVPAILVLASVLTEQQVPPGVLTQAFAWLNSASAAGSAAAAAVAGVMINHFGARGGFGLATGAAVTMMLLATRVAGTGTRSGRQLE